ncbi:response regulator transcription factor [Mucilaginibacter terrigena]|uniref:Phosphate regulon transcriptional regulatory protein PhoB n=1 Tax=Mucilaginibacter terrigena TaxID=2492395 RepID=A0A4Q5LLM4_9SPHI|nr:response regulator transcription factor [Mucilaginibacter terrigena]RYU89602.1 response regulator transcription factor [Mucilaginibacter terrigena]
MKKILLVEDDPDIIQLLNLHLSEPAYHLTACSSGNEAIQNIRDNAFDFVLLDIMLPDKDGIEVCKAIREQKIKTPIMMLSSRSEEIDKVLALEMGADDYMTKPFSIRELTARIKAHLRSREPVLETVPSEIRFKDLVIDSHLKKATLKNKRLELTQKEFDLLLQLAQNPGKTYSRLELLALVWKYTISDYEHTVTSHINRLRIKIEANISDPQYILTSWGVGYRFADETPEQ